MIECAARGELAAVLVEHHDLHLVVVLLDEAAERQAEALVRPYAPIHAVQSPRRLVLVDLLALDGCLTHGRVGGGGGDGGQRKY